MIDAFSTMFKKFLVKSIQSGQKYFDVSDEFEIILGDATSLNVTISNCDIRIFASEDNKIKQKVFVTNKLAAHNFKINTLLQDDVLRYSANLPENEMQAYIELYIPCYNVLFINSSNGDISINDVKSKKICVTLRNGDVVSRNAKFDFAKINNTNGDTILKLNDKYKLMLECENGDIVSRQKYDDKNSTKELLCNNINGDIIFE